MLTNDDYSQFENLSVEKQNEVLEWIKQNLVPIKSFNPKHDSYELKHLVRFSDGKRPYLTNGQFKGAMLRAGYRVQDMNAQNWKFNISERSPALKKGVRPW